MTDQKRKRLYLIFKILSIVISCALPIWAIVEKFPLWTAEGGAGRSIGTGVIMIAIVLVIVFRRTVFDYIRDRIDLKHAPPILIWCVLIIISYSFIYISNALRDMNTVFWMGLIGCVIGNVFTYIAEHKFSAKDGDGK